MGKKSNCYFNGKRSNQNWSAKLKKVMKSHKFKMWVSPNSCERWKREGNLWAKNGTTAGIWMINYGVQLYREGSVWKMLTWFPKINSGIYYLFKKTFSCSSWISILIYVHYTSLQFSLLIKYQNPLMTHMDLYSRFYFHIFMCHVCSITF